METSDNPRWMMRRRILCAALVLLGACNDERDRPNVLLVTLDTTRADHLSCYGYGTETSPRLDALAADGVRFTHAVSQAAVTPVSHASILTGRLPYHHGVRVMHGMSENKLPASAVTLAEILRADGYRTGAFVSAFPVTAEFGFDQGFETFDAAFLPDDLSDLVDENGAVNTGQVQRMASETVARALVWLQETPGPFFLWLHLFDPHDALIPVPEDFMAHYPPLPEPERDRLRAIYDIEIAFMDRELGRVFDALQGERWERTVVAVTSDHGEGLGDHGWWSHGILFQEQVRIPLLLRAAALPAGVVVDDMVSSIDLMPTLLELVGLPAKRWPTIDGRSLVASAHGDGVEPVPLAYGESINRMTYILSPAIRDAKTDLHFALCDGRWKYVHHLLRPQESELYDLQEDPGELVNLYDEDGEAVERLRSELMSREFLPQHQLEETGVPGRRLEALRALGYSGK